MSKKRLKYVILLTLLLCLMPKIAYASESEHEVDVTVVDSIPPEAVTDLAVSNPAHTSLTLSWTAPGDDGNSGTAAQYDIRYSEAIIDTEVKWQAATKVANPPTPQSAGSIETFVVTGLSSCITYYFALKTADEAPNWSVLSNSPHGKTSCGGGSGGGGGGGGGGGPAITVDYDGTTFQLQITPRGILLESLVLTAPDGVFTLEIRFHTRVLTAEGKVPEKIRVRKVPKLPLPPEGFEIVGDAYEFSASIITFDPPARLTFHFDPNQLPESTEDVVLAYHTPETGWVELETEKQNGIAGGLSSLVSKVSHFTTFSVLAKLSLPTFEVTSFEIRPSQATIGETVTIVIGVANIGGIEGSYTPKLEVDGIVKAVREITLDPGESKTVSFELTGLSLGEHQVEINSLTGELSVVLSPPAEPPEEEEAPPTPVTNWWLVGGILAGLALLLVIVFILVL